MSRAHTFRSVLLIVFLLILAAPVFAQESESERLFHEASDMPFGARYQIVQSSLSSALTFRLDRHTGEVDILGTLIGGIRRWDPIAAPPGLPVTDSRWPRFILFMSGLGAIDTFLMDTSSGETWTFRVDSEDGGWFWGIVLE